MSGSELADEGWSRYYAEQKIRRPRELLLDALSHLTHPQWVVPRHAVDLGCGTGSETIALLRRGWTVLAVDAEAEAIDALDDAVPAEVRPRLETRIGAMETMALPRSGLIWAGFSLPFCPPAAFPNFWIQIVAALPAGGVFAGQLFGVRDDWSNDRHMTFHTRDEVDSLLEPFEILVLDEVDEDGFAVSGPKHWHLFHVIIRRRT